MNNIIHSNVSVNKGKAYLIYIGNIKYIEYNDFLIKPLRKYYKKPVEIIYILPNFPPSNFKKKFIVVNDKLGKIKDNKKYHYTIPQSILNKEVSNNKYVKRLIRQILKNQKDLFLSLFKDTPEMTLQKIKNIRLIGPKVELFDKYRNKLFQHKLIQKLNIPQAKWILANNRKQMINYYKKYFKNGAFITKTHSCGGKGCAVIKNKEKLENPHLNRKNCRYILSRLLTLKDSPTASAIIANNESVFFLYVVDQIMDKADYLGSIFPSKLSNKTKELIKEYTLKIGKHLGKKGYSGFFDVDFIVTKNNKLFFGEINPRRDGSYVEKVLMHEISKNSGFPSLPELEFRAIINNDFGELKYAPKNIRFNWGVMDIKLDENYISNVDSKYNEKRSFKMKKSMFLSYVPKNSFFLNEGRLGKILSIRSNRKEVLKELGKRRKNILSKVKYLGN